MSADYVPREGTVAHQVIEHLTALPAGARLRAPELAAAVGMEKPAGLSTMLRKAVAAGLIDIEGAGHATTYGVPVQVGPTDGKLAIATYSDGDVSVKGGLQADDGSVQYTREQMQQLLLQVTRPHVTLAPGGE